MLRKMEKNRAALENAFKKSEKVPTYVQGNEQPKFEWNPCDRFIGSYADIAK